jgi:hypothetical protein
LAFRRGRCPACAKTIADALKSATRSAAQKCTQFKKTLPPVQAGERFGAWTVLADERREGKYFVAQVRCDCGTISATSVDTLHKGSSTRCRTCAIKKGASTRKEFYGFADVCPDDDLRRRLMNRISACLNRCHNPNDSGYASYGGRGIHVFEPWRTDRKAFLAYLMTLPEVSNAARLDMDRINTEEGYEPGNIRFVSRQVNVRNKRQVNALSMRILKLEQELKRLKDEAESV